MIDIRSYRIDLQLFAEKTEAATPKRRQELREKGQIPKSRELVTALMLLISFWSFKLLAPYIFNDIVVATRHFLSFSKDIDTSFKIESLMSILLYCMLIMLKTLGPILLIIAIVAIAVNYFQVGNIHSIKPVTPSLNKLNPLEGFKRLFSKHSFIELLKSIFKICIVGYVVYDFFTDNYKIIPELIAMDIRSTVVFIGNTIVSIGIRAAVVLLIMAVFDYAFQIWDYERNIRMSKQEVKDEYKQIEGNPQIKSKIREKQRQMAIRRMMAEVPKADVIITNPTHFAVAVKYDADEYDAPVVVAKGKDLIAQKIKDTAKENKVPIVENKPLAQTLYKTVEIGDKIPEELYKAVAEVLAFVYSLRDR